MFKIQLQRFLIIISLILITPLGFLSKFYHGTAQDWINNFSGDILYEIFWCLLLFLLMPSRKSVVQIPLGVLIITCILEISQLWKPPFLQAIRATFWGKIFLGTTFVWWDFPHYIVGCIISWLWLRQIWKLSIKNHPNVSRN